MELSDRTCFSRVPVPSCSPMCVPSGGRLSTKGVGFACMPKGRVAERYAEKARRGENLPELQRMEEQFRTQLQVPQSCVQV